MQNAIKQMHTDESGKLSSVRILSSMTVIVGLILAILASFEVGEAAKVFGSVLATSVTMLGMGQGKSAYVTRQQTVTASATTTVATDSQSALAGATGGGSSGKST